MAFIPGLLVAEINLNQRLHGEQVQNTIYAVNFAGWTPAGLELLVGEMITWVGSFLYVPLSQDISLFEVTARDISTQDGAQFTASPTAPVIGLAGGQALPGNCAIVVTFRTGLTGRSRRGRNYVAGIREADSASNAVNGATVDAIRTAYENLVIPFGAAGCNHVVFSRFTNKAPRALGVPTIVTSYTADTNLDSQRRRLAGRGV